MGVEVGVGVVVEGEDAGEVTGRVDGRLGLCGPASWTSLPRLKVTVPAFGFIRTVFGVCFGESGESL